MSQSPEQKEKEFLERRAYAMNFGTLVYVGGVAAATVLFINFVLTAFPEDAYFSRVLMTVAGIAVGLSMLAFPYALHHWIITKKHRQIGVPLYYGELFLISVNTVVAFMTLLSEYAGMAAPEWAVLYDPFSVASILSTVGAWGTLFLTDPEAQRNALERQFRESYEDAVSRKKQEFLNSIEGEQAVADAATEEIRVMVLQGRVGSKHFGTGKTAIPASAPFVRTEAVTSPLPRLDDA